MTAPNRDVNIRTTVTANSIQKLFGAPGTVDYRSHPGQREADAPHDIFKSMRQKEVTPLQDIKFLKGTIYSYKNRKIITRWLRDVCAAFQLKGTTLALAVQLTDAFIIGHLDTLAVNACQLAAVSSLWIASKFEELDDAVPKLKSVVDVCDGAYTAPDVVTMEEDVLSYFKWRIPHTTVMNHLYLLFHVHSIVPVADVGPAPQGHATTSSANGNTDGGHDDAGIQVVEVVTVDPETKMRSVTATTISKTSTIERSLAILCNAARIPASHAVEVFQLRGCDFLVARKVLLSETPAQMALPNNVLRLFLANSASGVSSVFAERNAVVLLRSVNGLLLHLALDVLAPEALTHVEFLRLPSHVVAVGILALARSLIATTLDETRTAIGFILKTLEISGPQSLAAADLLLDKYQDAMQQQPEQFPPPSVPCPPDARDRLRYVFQKGGA